MPTTVGKVATLRVDGGGCRTGGILAARFPCLEISPNLGNCAMSNSWNRVDDEDGSDLKMLALLVTDELTQTAGPELDEDELLAVWTAGEDELLAVWTADEDEGVVTCVRRRSGGGSET